jgi:hypothetical protein
LLHDVEQEESPMPGDEYAIDRYGSLPYWLSTILALVLAGVFAEIGSKRDDPLRGQLEGTNGTL